MSDEIEEWDEAVSEVLAGRGRPGSDATALWLATAARPTPSGSLVSRVDRAVADPARRNETGRRDRAVGPGRWVALVAAALAVAFVMQGLGSLFAGSWIATNLGEAHAPHASFEGGLALIALGVCAAAAVVSRAWSGVSVLTCAPLALALGISGVGEIGSFAAGAVLHLSEGALGLLLVAAWLWERRDARGFRREGGT